MTIFFHILLSVGFYFILLYVSINLLGLFVRGLFTNPELEKLKTEGHEFIKNEVAKYQRADKWINLIAVILIIGYLYLLFHFWNIGIAAVAVALMLSRLPDLLWEIQHGKKVTLSVTKSMPKNAGYFITAFITWAALPATYFFLYHF